MNHPTIKIDNEEPLTPLEMHERYGMDEKPWLDDPPQKDDEGLAP